MGTTTVRRTPAHGGSLRRQGVSADLHVAGPISDRCCIAARSPMPSHKLADLADSRPRFPFQVNVRLDASTFAELIDLARELDPLVGALTRRLLIAGPEHIAGRRAD